MFRKLYNSLLKYFNPRNSQNTYVRQHLSMVASVAKGNKKTLGGPFGKIGISIGIGVGIQIQMLSFT